MSKILQVGEVTEEGKKVLETVETPEGTVQVQEDYDKLTSERDPSAAAGALFALYGPQLFNLVGKLSNRQLRRLIKALVTWPLEEIDVNKHNPLEMNAYQIANKMIESRFLLTLAVAYEEQEKNKAISEENKKKAEEAKQLDEAK